MVNAWFDLPPFVQALFLFAWGAVVGGQVNRGIYRLAWTPRRIGPWSPSDAAAPSRRWWDRLPIVGWWTLRRESSIHGAGFWVRPLLIEAALAGGLTWLYFFELNLGLLPEANLANPVEPELLLTQFIGHAVLICLMVVATFIDFDEKTIPDAITLPGTLAGLVFATALPASGLPVLTRIGASLMWDVSSLRLHSPLPWPEACEGPRGLILGLFCYLTWCVALIPRRWITRRGLSKAVTYLLVSMWRSGACVPLAALAAAGSVAIAGVWWAGQPWWPSLLSSLVGMAAGGGIIWVVRIVAGAVLQEEAMGFGDVTLMAMIGAFLGWQATVIVFFLAPFAALFIAVGQWLITRRRDIAFGPYLCFAAVLLIVRWKTFWHGSAAPVFSLGWQLPALLLVCLLALGPMLWTWRAIRWRLFGY